MAKGSFGKLTKKFGTNKYTLKTSRTRKTEAQADVKAFRKKGFTRVRIVSGVNILTNVREYLVYVDLRSQK